MRLKTFHANTMQEVMDDVRTTLGADAIIVQVDEGGHGVRVTAALEGNATPPPPKAAPIPNQTPVEFEVSHPIPKAMDFDAADVSAILNHHALPFETADHFKTAIASIQANSLSEAFAAALDAVVRFSPLTDRVTRPIMLVGPPGVGKTVSAAKLTADALLHSKTVHLITTDTVKAGGVQQLDHFAQLMKQTVSTAETHEELAAVMRAHPGSADLTLIDTAGTNPFDINELKSLLQFIRAVDAEPVLVMPAGLDPLDAQEIAGVFARMGCQRFIATRLDAARRYAGLIMAARPGYLALAGISRSPFIADGLEPATPANFAKLLTSLPNSRSIFDKKEQH